MNETTLFKQLSVPQQALAFDLEMLAVLNNTVLGLFARQGETNIAHARRAFAYYARESSRSLSRLADDAILQQPWTNLGKPLTNITLLFIL